MGGPCILVTKDGSRSVGPAVTDNFFVRPFVFDGITFHSVEQAFQALKFPRGSPIFVSVASVVPIEGESDSSHGLRAWRAGQGGSLPQDWDKMKVELMLKLVRTRTQQHSDLREQLLSTGDASIEGEPSTGWEYGDKTWNWSYFNGAIMTLVREELRREAAGSSSPTDAELKLMAMLDAYQQSSTS